MSTEDEEWRAVIGYEGSYEVSSLGRVRSCDRYVEVAASGHGRTYRPGYSRFARGIPIRQSLRRDGYLKVGLHDGRGDRQPPVHRIVCEAFHGSPQSGQDAAHGDGVKTNNRADNLRWATRAENMADKVLHGTHARGDRAPSVKLDVQKVAAIRVALGAGASQRSLAREYGVSPSAINLIALGRNWAWLD